MGVPNPIAASQRIDACELQPQIYHQARLWKRDLKRPHPLSLIHLKKLAAILIMLGFVSWLWFGVSMYQAPRASFPYYDTQKPVPPWSEPMPLEGNYGRAQEHR